MINELSEDHSAGLEESVSDLDSHDLIDADPPDENLEDRIMKKNCICLKVFSRVSNSAWIP